MISTDTRRIRAFFSLAAAEEWDACLKTALEIVVQEVITLRKKMH